MATAVAANPVTAYAEGVSNGEIVAGRLVQLACARYLRDLEHGHERGLWFDEEAADRAIGFFRLLRLTEGEFAGQEFVLQPFQQFIVGSLFGWKGADNYRRFRKAYLEIGKGNGKSPLAAAIGVFGLIGDGEMGAEIYSAAVTADQARIVFNDAKHMVEDSPALASRVEVGAHNLAVLPTRSFFRTVSSEARSLDGKRVHMALVDELHEHPTGLVVEKMQAGTKARRQPLIFEITNSGYDRTSVCWEHHQYAANVLEGVIEDDGWFAFVCQLDPCEQCQAGGALFPNDDCLECDDWRDEEVWLKVNPNLGVSVTHKYLREQVHEAAGMPSKQNIVKRLNFCIWTEQATRWFDMSLWDACSVQPVVAPGALCFAGLDLSSKVDITALLLLFPQGKRYDILTRFWIPEANMEARIRRDKVPYDVWVRQGLVTPTPGEIIDYDYISQEIRELSSQFQIQEIAYDPWGAGQLATQLRVEGASVVEVRNIYAHVSEACKELEAMLASGGFRHGGNPVLRWMAANVTTQESPDGSGKRPIKANETGRIDGIMALVMALSRATVHQQQPVIEPRSWSWKDLQELATP